MAGFWDDVKAANGENTMGVITMAGELANEKGDTNAQGARWISATASATPVPVGYTLTIVADKANNSAETKYAYWLPWKNISVEKVMMSALNASGCDYFLTSMLTGCRFVATDIYVAHISNEQASGQDITTTQQARDAVETPLMMKVGHRRKLSITAQDKRGIDWTGEDTISSYKRSADLQTGSAFVIGYKDEGAWKFKWLKHSLGENFPDGVWSILE